MTRIQHHETDTAETLALQALGFLLARDDLLPVFLEASGCGPADLAQSAGDPHFLAAVLDFVLQDDRRVLEFSDAESVSPESVLRARVYLPGGDLPHWT